MRTKMLSPVLVVLVAAGLFSRVVLAASFNVDFLNLREVIPGTNTLDAYLKVKAVDVWQFLNGSTLNLSPVIVGIVDTGVVGSHPEFGGVDFGNSPANAKIDSGIFSAGLGKVDTHGTNVNGIVGANNISATSSKNYAFPQINGMISGVNNLEYVLDNRKIDFGGLGITTLFSSVKNVFELADDGAKIINLSFGGSAFNPLALPTFFATISSYPDVFFVVGAGNDSLSAEFFAPASLGDNLDNVITVGATELDDSRASFSNFGSAVNIAAPGGEMDGVWSPTFFEEPLDLSDYRFFSGTSASVPLVASVAVILKAIKPTSTPAEIKQILTETADPLFVSSTGPEVGRLLGSGCSGTPPPGQVLRGCRLNALRAVQAVLVPKPAKFTPDANTYAYYAFDNNILDSSDKGNNLTVSRGIISFIDGIIDQAAGFNNSETFIHFGNWDNLNAPGQQWTISFWIKTTDTRTNLIFFFPSQGCTEPCDIGITEVNMMEGHLRWRNVDSGISVSDGEWHHVVYRSPQARVLEIWKDGILQIILDTDTVLRDCCFGFSVGGGSFMGFLDEVIVENRAFSENEIRALAGR